MRSASCTSKLRTSKLRTCGGTSKLRTCCAEIYKEVGEDKIFIFGTRAEHVDEVRLRLRPMRTHANVCGRMLTVF
jgi:hypothetical protein